MKRFKNILFIFDQGLSTDAAFQRAVDLAKRNEARLTVAVCLEGMETSRLASSADDRDSWTMIRHEWQNQLNQLCEPLEQQGVATKSVILEGIGFIEIVRHVLRRDHDLVMKAAEAPGGVRNLLFGSTDLHLMRKCPCPVWIHRDGEEDPYLRVLAAVDVSGDNPEEESMNRLILDLASSLAAREHAELHVAHAWHLPGKATLQGRAFGERARTEVRRMVMDLKETRLRAFETLLHHYKPFAPASALLEGEPNRAIPEHAAKVGADLIVMGTVGRTGVPGLLIGNTAEEILRQVNSSVLTVKPSGFVTPITEVPTWQRREVASDH